jgi:hypothetical protein
MLESGEQIRETDFEKILNYYKDKGQLRHQALTALYLYTSMRLEYMFKLRWKDVYDFGRQSFYTYHQLWIPDGAEEEYRLSPALIPALTAYMESVNPLPGEPILNCGNAGVIGFSFRVIREAMTSVWRCCLIEPCDMRQAFKATELFRGAEKLRAASPYPASVGLISPPRRIPFARDNRNYETDVTKRGLVRLLNDYLEEEQFQSHVILAMYLYSDITVKGMTRIRWKNVYNFRTRAFHKRISCSQILSSDNIFLTQEITQALLIYMARRPEIQPEDFVLTSRGKQMRPNAAYRCIRKAMGRLTDVYFTRFNELRAWARQTLAGESLRRNRPGA